MANIKNQSLLYHMTDIDNLSKIFEQGLLSRSKLTNFVDIADPEILNSRSRLKLEEMVPFHFFARNLFDARVQLDNRDKEFVIISVQRIVAKNNNWKIISEHPLSADNLQLLDYEEGFDRINWDSMNEKNYQDKESRNACMAECLSLVTVSPVNFHSVYVRTNEVKQRVDGILRSFRVSPYVNVNEKMFIGK